MIQRIQSIFLLLAAAAMITTIFLPSWSFVDGEFQEVVSGLMVDGPVNDIAFNAHEDGSRNAFHMGFVGMMGLSGVLLLVTIFLFNDRKRQRTFAYLSVIPGMIGLVMLFLLTQNGPEMIATDAVSNPSFGVALPVVGILLAVLAARFIDKDQKLVDSLNSDRIR
ncbi:MAG: DUF4293 domain-containing protein [Bacteroidota bacterium]